MGEEPSEVTSEHWSGKSLDRVVIKINRLDAPIASGYVVEMSPLVSSSKCAPTQETRHPDHQVQTVTRESPPCAKIELFRSLFRGRTDVYPRRFESRKTGKAGYAPACANEWVRGICEKPRIKCADCPNRRFLPVTDDVIRWHLSGRDDQGRDFVMGVIPCFRTKPVISWQLILTGRIGRRMQVHSSKRADGSTCRSPWNGRGPAMAGTFGSSLKRP